MNEVISEHDQLKNIFTQLASNPNLHPLIKQIDEWEKESIAKIHQKAKELREKLLQPTTTQISELSKRLELFSEQLNRRRESDDFVETDLSFWKEKLDALKSDLTSPLKFAINHDDDAPLVRNISFVLKTINERFERVFDDKLRIVEDGEAVINGGSTGWSEIRGTNEYSSGCHKIRLRIERVFDAGGFFGINSKATPLKSLSFSSKTACGWSSNNCINSNGLYMEKSSGHRIEININDIITLIFDCDKRKISMINERTNVRHGISVNIEDCPFPWQLHVNIGDAQGCIRILPQKIEFE
jgi:hypothetical protein